MLPTDVISILNGHMRTIDPMHSGGEKYRIWAQEFLQYSVSHLNIVASGGLVVPQFGQDVGKPISFVSQGFQERDCIQLPAVLEITSAYSRGIASSTVIEVTCTHPEKHLNCILAPIAMGLDNPIGYFWALAQKGADSASVAAILQHAVDCIALLGRSERAISALRILSRSAWLKANTTMETAVNIAEGCREALSCSAVIVWKSDQDRRTLKTLASVGNTRGDLNFDMVIGRGVAGKCAQDSRTIIIDDLQDHKELSEHGIENVEHPGEVKRLGWHSAIFVPLDIGTESIGVVSAYGPRPRGFSALDSNVVEAFAQRLCSGYVHVRRVEELSEMERRISMEAPTIEAGILAMERVHDIDNQLLLAQGQLSEITSRFRHDETHPVRKAALAASNYVDEAHKTVKAFVRRSRLKKVVLSQCDVSALLRDLKERVKLVADTAGIEVHLRCPEELIIKADEDQLSRVFLNLINNSIFWLETDKKGGKREINISVECTTNSVVMRFKDNGPGIASYDIPKLFHYFYTTKGERGMGFGLAMSKRIVQAHNGIITIQSRWGYETEFTITLPYSTGS